MYTGDAIRQRIPAPLTPSTRIHRLYQLVCFNNDCTFILLCGGLSTTVCVNGPWWELAFNHITVWIYLEIYNKKRILILIVIRTRVVISRAPAPQPFSAHQRPTVRAHSCRHSDLSTRPGSTQCREEAIKVMKEAKAIKEVCVCEGSVAEMSLSVGGPRIEYTPYPP